MRIYKKHKVTEKVLDRIICNNCGVEYIPENEEWGFPVYPFVIHFGYESRHDLEHWHFDLCESCIEKLVSSFEIKPIINDGDALGNKYERNDS